MAPTSAAKPLRWSALGAETWNVKSGVGIGMGTSTSPEKLLKTLERDGARQ